MFNEALEILTLIVALLSGGTIPFIIKLYKDKKKLKAEQEQIQNKKIELLGDILIEYINDNGSKESTKKRCNRMLKKLKEI